MLTRKPPVSPEPDATVKPPSAAATWSILQPFIAAEAHIGARMAATPLGAGLYEFLRFGMKQAWACLFGAAMIALIVGTWLWYPAGAPLARYDFLFLAALAVQAGLLIFRLETVEEAKIILVYHIVGTVMEIFKTSVGSWIYPEEAFFRIAGVPLFTGFMYACIGSYIARSWRLFHFEFTNHPPIWALSLLSLAIYINFYSHHYIMDFRIELFAVAIALFLPTRIYFLNWRTKRWMPLLLGLVLVSVFIWFAENIGTFTRTWMYPNQRAVWSMVGIGKLGSWFLLLIISYTLVAFMKRNDIHPPSSPGKEPARLS
jgi:uncharacterized membrane protein YoaT (DUF817 family)